MHYLLVREPTSSCQPERRCRQGQLKCRKRIDPVSEATFASPQPQEVSCASVRRTYAVVVVKVRVAGG